MLLLAEERPLAVSDLVDLLWTGRDVGRGSIHVAVSRLRTWLEAHRSSTDRVEIVTDGGGYRLAVDAEAVDLGRFRSLLRRAEAVADSDERYALLFAATQLSRGPVLADVTGVDLTADLVRAVDDTVCQAGLAFGALALRIGNPADAVGCLDLLARAHPFAEPVHAQLITALAAAGRPAQALSHYATLRVRLAEELGVAPSRAVDEAYRAVLASDRPVASAPAAPVHRPAPVCQLPPRLPDFTGQRTALLGLTAALHEPGEDPPLAVVSGPGGVGKTSLAVECAHQLRETFPDGQLFVSLGGARSPATVPVGVLSRILRSLGEPTPPSSVELDEVVARYRSALHGRRVLLVLDDAATAAQVRPLLPASAGSATVVTSRSRMTALPATVHLDLGPFDDVEALHMMERVLGPSRVRDQPEAARELIRLCARLPLALRITASRLAARPHWPVSRLVERMRDASQRLDELKIDDLELRASLALSYHSLPPAVRTALRVLGHLDLPDFAPWMLSALLAVPADLAGEYIEQLVDAHLVEVASPDPSYPRYRMHDFVRLYAQERAGAEDSAADLAAGVARVVASAVRLASRLSQRVPYQVVRSFRLPMPADSLLGALEDEPTPWPDEAAVQQWLDVEEPNLVALVERAAALGLHDLTCGLAETLALTSFSSNNNFDAWNRTHTIGLRAARATGNRHIEAAIECGMGQLRYKEDRFAEARQHFARALTLSRRHHDRHGTAIALTGLGTVGRELGQHRSALPALERALLLLEELGDREGLAYVHYGIGYCYRETARDVLAREQLERSAALYQQVGHLSGVAVAWRGIGLVYRARGELDAAEHWCARAHELAADAADRLLVCYTSQALSKVWIRRGDPDRARAPLAAALETCTRRRDRLGAALIRRTIGELHLAAGELDAAREALSQAHGEWQAMHHRLGAARTLRDLGIALARSGDEAGARRAWSQAVRTFRRLGVREKDEAAGWAARDGWSADPMRTR